MVGILPEKVLVRHPHSSVSTSPRWPPSWRPSRSRAISRPSSPPVSGTCSVTLGDRLMSGQLARASIVLSLTVAGVVTTHPVASTRSAPPGVVASAPVDSAIWKTYRWRSLGPDRGGRALTVSGVRGQPSIGYFGATGGGLWKTTDGGTTWAPITDNLITSASVGAMAVSESNPNVIFIGTGEACIRGDIRPGDGVYKST